MMLLDTNVILRYLLDDIKEQADIAESAIGEGAYSWMHTTGRHCRMAGGTAHVGGYLHIPETSVDI